MNLRDKIRQQWVIKEIKVYYAANQFLEFKRIVSAPYVKGDR